MHADFDSTLPAGGMIAKQPKTGASEERGGKVMRVLLEVVIDIDLNLCRPKRSFFSLD